MTTRCDDMRRAVAAVGCLLLVHGLQCSPDAWANDTEDVPVIREAPLPADATVVLFDDGRTVWWCLTGEDDDGRTRCEKAVVYPAGSFGFPA